MNDFVLSHMFFKFSRHILSVEVKAQLLPTLYHHLTTTVFGCVCVYSYSASSNLKDEKLLFIAKSFLDENVGNHGGLCCHKGSVVIDDFGFDRSIK